MSNQTADTFHNTDAAGPLKDGLERERHLPTMPDPSQDQGTEVSVPTEKDPSKKPSQIDEPRPIGDKDETEGFEQIA